MSFTPLVFGIAILLVLYFSSTGFDIGAFDVTLIVFAAFVGIGIWVFTKGLGGD